MRKRLDEMAERYGTMGDNRGVGLMQATEFVEDRATKKPAPDVRDKILADALKHGLVLLGAGTSAIRFIPALNIPDELLDAGLDILNASIRKASR
jgi:4-aminobutyrate aminotransferase